MPLLYISSANFLEYYEHSVILIEVGNSTLDFVDVGVEITRGWMENEICRE